MATDERDCFFSGVKLGECPLKVAVEGSLASDNAARRHRRSMSRNRRSCGRDNARVLIQAKVIVRGKICIALLADPDVGAQPRIVTPVERVSQAEQLRNPAMFEDCLVCREV